MFASKEALLDLIGDMPKRDDVAFSTACNRQRELTKPVGSLGRLEELATWLCGWSSHPQAPDPASILVFAGNHGVAARRVSAYPSEVTAQMVENFGRGGAAVNQLARVTGAELSVVPLWLDQSTRDFTLSPAMSSGTFLKAVAIGFAAVPGGCRLLAVGEMGIGNTTTASALCASILGGPVADWVGFGTGVDEHGWRRKVAIVERAVAAHADVTANVLDVAAALGGHELAAIFGAVLAARSRRIPVILDGFAATAAVLPLAMISRGALDHCRLAHLSVEPGHRRLADRLGLEPILDLRMRLGEASGAALAIPIVRAAAACHFGMATFSEAGVSGRGGRAGVQVCEQGVGGGPTRG